MISEKLGEVVKCETWGSPWGMKWSHGICGFSCVVFMF